MELFIGIDIGSAHAKGVILGGRERLGTCERPSGGNYRGTAEKIRDELLSQAGFHAEDVARSVATGYGAKQIAFADEIVTDVSCHAKGIFSHRPTVRTAVDIGDLYGKAFRLDGQGNQLNFVMSSKCAGGSGRALKVISKVLQVGIEDIGELSLMSKNPVEFTTSCTVFAESEAISLIAEGVAKEDLLAGIHRALAAQLHSLAERMGVEEEYAITGGGARDIGLVKAMEEVSKKTIYVPPEPHMTAALGAALIAREKTRIR
jgi:predicted CoA-substrate-specific enzyme activase